MTVQPAGYTSLELRIEIGSGDVNMEVINTKMLVKPRGPICQPAYV